MENKLKNKMSLVEYSDEVINEKKEVLHNSKLLIDEQLEVLKSRSIDLNQMINLLNQYKEIQTQYPVELNGVLKKIKEINQSKNDINVKISNIKRQYDNFIQIITENESINYLTKINGIESKVAQLFSFIGMYVTIQIIWIFFL